MGSRRALGRWSWRLIRQERRQQVAVILLIAAAITIATFGASVVGNTTSPPTRSGSASHELVLDENSAPLDEQIAAAQERFAAIDVTRLRKSVQAGGSNVDLVMSDATVGGRFGQSMLTLSSGRMPTGPGEIGLTKPALAALAVERGDELEIDGRSYLVTGVVEAPLNLKAPMVVVAKGQLAKPDIAQVLVATSNAEVERFQRDQGMTLVQSTSYAQQETARVTGTVTVVALSSVGMIEIGLLCSAGFAVMARRRLREFGLLAAVGARERQLRQAMTLNGLILGVMGAAAGTFAGYGLSVACRPWLEDRFGYRLDRWAVPWLAVVPFVALAAITAAVAAWWPARALSKVPVTDALSARRPVARPVRRTALWGVVAAVVGAAAFYRGVHVENAALGGGGIAVAVLGILAVTPAVIAWLGRVSGVLPLPLRLAGRDLARNQARSAATLAALVVAFGLPLGVGISGTAVDARNRAEPLNLPESTANIWHVLPRSRFQPPPSSFDPAAVQSELDVMRRAVPGATLVPVEMAVDPSAPETEITFGTGDLVKLPGVLVAIEHHQDAEPTWTGPVWVATPELLVAWGLDGALADSTADLLGPAGEVEFAWPARPQAAGQPSAPPADPPTVQTVAVPDHRDVSPYWIPRSRLAAHGLVGRTAGWAIHAPAPLTVSQRDQLRRAAGATLIVETTVARESTRSVRMVAWLGGGVIAMSILAISLALLRSETAEERSVLAAVGAPLRTRRRITAATAALLSGAGVALAIPTGYLALIGLLGNPTAGYGFVVPWQTLAIVVPGVPLLATAGAWLFGGTLRPAR